MPIRIVRTQRRDRFLPETICPVRIAQTHQPGSLKVRPDGTVLDGHHRLAALLEHGEDIHQLPREILEKES